CRRPARRRQRLALPEGRWLPCRKGDGCPAGGRMAALPGAVACPPPPRRLAPVGMPSPFSIPNFRAFWVARFAGTVASLMMVIVIGWQVYDIARETRSPKDASFLLGMIGLAEFLPLFLLALVVGYIADRVDR